MGEKKNEEIYLTTQYNNFVDFIYYYFVSLAFGVMYRTISGIINLIL